tara:strand:+ start:2191 stop:2982 length:792 start_codon:yes stop_codon:yes gene_type:complete
MNWKISFYFIGFLFTIINFSCSQNILDAQLFGIPVSNTGLTNLACNTDCKDVSITSKRFSNKEIGLMKSYINTKVFDEILENPYKQNLLINSEGVCAVIIENVHTKKYHLETFDTKEAAQRAGAIVTHIDACGACSTLKDLIVYAERLDLGADVRKCAIQNLTKPFDSLLVCIESLGFTKSCAQIWAYNVKNTQAKCFTVCINNNRYNKNNGTLSKCLQCDEKKSGPVFKAVAGRTRRNTGIANAICRFCDEVEVVKHNYLLE